MAQGTRGIEQDFWDRLFPESIRAWERGNHISDFHEIDRLKRHKRFDVDWWKRNNGN